MQTTSHVRMITFPEFPEEELRSRRLRAFSLMVCLSVVPYAVSVFWKTIDGLQWSIFLVGVPDLAFISVAIAIVAYGNTFISFLKANGSGKLSGRTYALGVALGALAFLGLVTYIRVTRAPPTDDTLSFIQAAFFALSTFSVAIMLQYNFLADEVRWAIRYRAPSSPPPISC